MALFSSTIILSVGVNYGLGLQYDDMEDRYAPITSMLSYAAGFCAILAAAWSKTPFAFSLLRITTGRLRWIVWFIIVTANVVLGVSATILWISCWPVEKLWNGDIDGGCWPNTVVEKYQTFSSGQWRRYKSSQKAHTDAPNSLLGDDGYRPCLTSLEGGVDSCHFQNRENRRAPGHERGCLVRDHLPHELAIGLLTRPGSSGIITFLKILVLPEMSDTTCELMIL